MTEIEELLFFDTFAHENSEVSGTGTVFIINKILFFGIRRN